MARPQAVHKYHGCLLLFTQDTCLVGTETKGPHVVGGKYGNSPRETPLSTSRK
jgi:hypothetical protein